MELFKSKPGKERLKPIDHCRPKLSLCAKNYFSKEFEGESKEIVHQKWIEMAVLERKTYYDMVDVAIQKHLEYEKSDKYKAYLEALRKWEDDIKDKIRIANKGKWKCKGLDFARYKSDLTKAVPSPQFVAFKKLSALIRRAGYKWKKGGKPPDAHKLFHQAMLREFEEKYPDSNEMYIARKTEKAWYLLSRIERKLWYDMRKDMKSKYGAGNDMKKDPELLEKVGPKPVEDCRPKLHLSAKSYFIDEIKITHKYLKLSLKERRKLVDTMWWEMVVSERKIYNDMVDIAIQKHIEYEKSDEYKAYLERLKKWRQNCHSFYKKRKENKEKENKNKNVNEHKKSVKRKRNKEEELKEEKEENNEYVEWWWGSIGDYKPLLKKRKILIDNHDSDNNSAK